MTFASGDELCEYVYKRAIAENGGWLDGEVRKRIYEEVYDKPFASMIGEKVPTFYWYMWATMYGVLLNGVSIGE